MTRLGTAALRTTLEPPREGEREKIRATGDWHFYTLLAPDEADGLGNPGGNVLHREEGADRDPGRSVLRGGDAEGELVPEKSDGEQAYWVTDGGTEGEVRGVQLADDRRLEGQHSQPDVLQRRRRVGEGPETGPGVRQPGDAKIWFDDVVVATEYIGPVTGKPKAGKKVGVPSRSALQTPGLVISTLGRWCISRSSRRGRRSLQGAR